MLGISCELSAFIFFEKKNQDAACCTYRQHFKVIPFMINCTGTAHEGIKLGKCLYKDVEFTENVYPLNFLSFQNFNEQFTYFSFNFNAKM